MKLRALEQRDAPLMLEWMHDASVVCHLGTNFMEKTLEDCCGFIRWANETQRDLHLAVADEQDTYMGTVSLKHIHAGTAEFAITVRACAMGKGYSRFAMQRILEHGIRQLGLSAIYWCVSRSNARAVRFYDKNRYLRTQNIPETILQAYTPEQRAEFIWYVYQEQRKESQC